MLHILNKGLLFFGTFKGYKLCALMNHRDILPAKWLYGWACNNFARQMFLLSCYLGHVKRYLLFISFLREQVNAGRIYLPSSSMLSMDRVKHISLFFFSSTASFPVLMHINDKYLVSPLVHIDIFHISL